ncbi:MAG: DNA double-strand break repair nuclease NurA [Chloroflexaceae bacterium]|nr:DNA double-strand break repair nuclease NurA [Chloroflexaceae bacterium]
MSLDLSLLGRQVRQMSETLARQADPDTARAADVMNHCVAQAGNEAHWRQALELSRESTNWLLAYPIEPLDMVKAAPLRPDTYVVIATDGSQIDVDRHGMLACYLINTGRVYLRYGEQAAARLSSQPNLYYEEHDLYLSDGARRVAIEGSYVHARRDVEELLAVVALADEWLNDRQDGPVLALQDGTLIRWTLASAEKFLQKHFVGRYLEGLDSLRERSIPVVSYTSRPRVTEMMGMIRLLYCPDVDVAAGRGARCAECSDIQAGRPPSCQICHGLVDADVLGQRLQEGERGPLFASMNRMNLDMYGTHRIHFFYLRVGRELARVELPLWLAEDPQQVDLIHQLVYDQCVKGHGYPVALARAHEQAVVRSGDRRTFQRMVQGSLLRADLPAVSSSKQEQKEYSRT